MDDFRGRLCNDLSKAKKKGYKNHNTSFNCRLKALLLAWLDVYWQYIASLIKWLISSTLHLQKPDSIPFFVAGTFNISVC